MSKVGFIARWGVVFSILGFFSLYSLAAFNVGHSSKAYADAISSDAAFRNNKDFVVMNDDDDDEGGGHGRGGHHHGPFHHRAQMICAVSQNQLDALRAAYTTAVFTTTNVGGQQKGIVAVTKTPGVTKHDVYQTIGRNPSMCRVIKTTQSFLLFSLPGVS